jgi:ferric-dicitrate binding protein FerR (iron transport regulator)
MNDFQTLKRKVEAGTATEAELIRYARLIEEINKEEIYKANEFQSLPEETMYHGVWQKIKENRRNKRVWIREYARLLVAASVILAIMTTVFVWLRHEQFSETRFGSNARTVAAPGKSYVKLPDGTTVLLNDSSELSYDFTGNERLVVLTGEGYFDVAHDPEKPFKVTSGEITTIVLGTAFNIRAYPNLDQITVTVLRGKVSVTSVNNEPGTLLPNQQAIFNKRTNKIETKGFIADKEVEWRKSIVILQGLTLHEAVDKIASRFNLKADLHDCQAKDCRLDLSFANEESAEQMMSVIAHLMAVEYQVVENTITVTGGEPCPASIEP